MEDFLQRLQNAHPDTKRKVLVVSSAVIMVAVVYVWLAYFNNLIANESFPAEAASENVSADAAGAPPGDVGAPSFWETMKRGSAVLYGNIAGGVSWIGDALRAPREYIVKPSR